MAQTPAPQAPEAKYVYCIIRSRDPRSFGPIGIGGRGDQVYTVHHEDLAAVVSDTPPQVYDPTEENALAHETVNATVMREFTVLPVAFSTVFGSEQDLIALLRNTTDALHDVLDKIEGKVEFDLRVFWDPERALAEVAAENEQVRQLVQQMSAGGGNAGYFGQIEAGSVVETALTERANAYIQEIYNLFRDVAVASRESEPIGAEMILNAAFLVQRADADKFVQRVEQIAANAQGRLVFRHTGPWPPYNFVNIRLKIDQGQQAA